MPREPCYQRWVFGGGWDVWWFIVKATVSRKPALISGNNGPSYITYSWGLYIYIILWQEWILSEIGQPGDRFNIKTSSYKYRDFHCKYKTVSPPFFLFTMGMNPYIWQDSFFYWNGAQVPICQYTWQMRNMKCVFLNNEDCRGMIKCISHFKS